MEWAFLILVMAGLISLLIPMLRKKKTGWDPEEHAQHMRNSMDYVSAFFLIDSIDAIDRCHSAVAQLLKRDILLTDDIRYFERIRRIYAAGENVVNVEHEMQFQWGCQDHRIDLLVHCTSPGKYEAELRMPGRIAANMEKLFGSGDDGRFWCGFMSFAFYD